MPLQSLTQTCSKIIFRFEKFILNFLNSSFYINVVSAVIFNLHIHLLNGYITYRFSLVATTNNALRNFNKVPLDAFINGGVIFMNQLLQNGG